LAAFACAQVVCLLVDSRIERVLSQRIRAADVFREESNAILNQVVVLVAATCLIVPALAEEAAQEVRQQIEAVHMKWLEALNKGDVEAFATMFTPATVQIDAFGRTLGVSPAVPRWR
jgi:hypothetical protein